MEKLVELVNLSKIYACGKDKVTALDGINLEIYPGELIAIVGDKGAGKSTLMHMMGCLEAPTAGNYFLYGEDVSERSDAKLSEIRNREIGFVFQKAHLAADLTVYENVELPLVYRSLSGRERRRLAMDALTETGMMDRCQEKPSNLSQEEQLRVVMARVLAQSPSLILADEPTGELDDEGGREIVKLLLHLHGKGRAVILLTQKEELALLAHRVIHLQQGRMIDDYVNGDAKAGFF